MMMMRWPCAAAILSGLAVATGVRSCNLVEDFGAAGDGTTADDAPLAEALAACESIVFPGPGRYLLSPFNLTSNQELVLEEGSVLLASTENILSWPLVLSYPSYEPGYPLVLNRLAPFIGAPSAANVTIRGAGTIDGQGGAWWGWDPAAHNGSGLSYGRPRLIEPTYCRNFTMKGVQVKDPPFWAVHPYSCEGVLLESLTFSAPRDSPNTDGRLVSTHV
jgi:polygalacturonase